MGVFLILSGDVQNFRFSLKYSSTVRLLLLTKMYSDWDIQYHPILFKGPPSGTMSRNKLINGKFRLVLPVMVNFQPERIYLNVYFLIDIPHALSSLWFIQITDRSFRHVKINIWMWICVMLVLMYCLFWLCYVLNGIVFKKKLKINYHIGYYHNYGSPICHRENWRHCYHAWPVNIN